MMATEHIGQRNKRITVDVIKKTTSDRAVKDNKLQIVNLSGMSLSTLSTPSLNLATITKLDLSNNNLEVIPESFTARMLNLVVLDVESNQLKTLPNSIGCLTKLKILNVSSNLLESLPKTIENCMSLEEITANFNKLTNLPETMGFELMNLKKLPVNSNKISFLPYSTSHMTFLRYLDAHLNCLQSLPEGLENLIRLETLNVSQNFQHLNSIPPSIGLMLSLTNLDISYNSITHLPGSLGCLMKLQKFRAEGNPLVCPPMEVVEQSIDAVRIYLNAKMIETDSTAASSKKGSWIKKLVKRATFSPGMRNSNVAVFEADRDDYLLSDYNSIEGFATPRRPKSHIGMFSPRRLFSPRKNKASVLH